MADGFDAEVGGKESDGDGQAEDDPARHDDHQSNRKKKASDHHRPVRQKK